MPIPGLEHIPVGVEDVSSTSGQNVTLFSFSLQPFKVPEIHMSGKCRHISEFNKVCHIVEGAFGTVYKVIDTKSGETVALKKLKIGKDEMSLMSIHFVREITILKSSRHANIVEFHGVAVGKNFESTYLILQYCPYNLSKVIDDKTVILEYPQIKYIMFQLFSGLAYIHDKFILHRDLTVTNILFTSSGILKISDFGFSRLCSSSEMTPNVVSRWYRAPEILFGSKNYTTAIDMWACGCIFAELLLRRPIFPADSDNDLIKLIIDTLGTPTETLWPGLSELPLIQSYELFLQPCNKLRTIFSEQSGGYISLIHKLFLYNPVTRYTAKASLEHTFFMEEPHACSAASLVPTLQAPDKI